MQDPVSLRALLAWTLIPGVGDRALAALLNHAREARLSLAGLWEAPPADLAAVVSLPARAVSALEDGHPAFWEEAGGLAAWMSEWGVEALIPGEPGYPARLPAARWPLLFAWGDLQLAEEPLVLLVSSRDPSEEAIRWTDRAADALARRDVALTAGLNREAYQATAVAAKRHGGAAALALDRGLMAAFPGGLDRDPVPGARVWDETLDPATQLMLSPFGLRDQWTPRGGPRRDALLFALAAAVVAVEVRPGGNIEREYRAAAERGLPLFALDSDASGGGALLDIVPPERRLRATLSPDEVAARLQAALPAAAAERARPPAGQRELEAFLLGAARLLVGTRLPQRAAVAPARGVLAQLARESALAPAVTRGEGASGLDLLIAGPDSGARVGDLAARLQPAGVLVAAVPAAWPREPRFADERRELLADGSLLAIVEVPAGEAPAAVLIYRRGASPGDEPPARVLAPPAQLATRHQLRRYLRQALDSLAAPGDG